MTPYILPFDSHRNEAAREIGGKALNLCRLRRNGFRVPPGFCVSVLAFDAMLAANPPLSALIDRWFAGLTSHETVRAAWEAAAWPEVLSEEIDRAVAGLDPAEPLAVRSSAIVEDSKQFSFAGQFETKLGIAGGDACRRALKSCWASLCSEVLRQHAIDHALTRHDLKMAVVVQTMIRPRVAGVLFTVDPMSQDRDRLRIEANYGLGEALVSGDITPDSVVVDKVSGAVIAQEIAHKASHLRYERGSVVDRPVPECLRDVLSLSAGDIGKLAHEARRIEAWAGRPQDIEWAFDGENLYIVQSRDITTLADIDSSLFTPQVIEGSWTRENMSERFYKVNTPFTISTLYPALEKGLEATFNRIGIRADKSSFGPLIRVFYGRPYLNKSLVAHALKGIKVDKTQMEAVLGKRENMGFNPRLPLIAIGVLRMISEGFKDWEAYQREALDPLVVPSEAELAAKSLPALRQLLDAQLKIFEQYWVVHMINVRCADFCQKIIRMLLGCVHASEEEAFDAFCRLSAGFAENITFDSDAELHRISRLILKKPNLATALVSGSHAAFQRALGADPAGPEIAARFDRFIARFGFKLEHQEFHDRQWRDSPELVWQHIAAAMNGQDEDPKTRVLKKVKEREHAFAATLSRFKGPLGFVLRPVFKSIYRKMCDYIPARENDQFHFGKLVYVMRRTLIHTGKRLVESGVLAGEDDIFFLELEKIPASTDGAVDLKGYVARQRALFAHYEAMDIPYDINDDAKPAQGANARAGWTGYGVSKGIVTATASIAHDPSELNSVGDGCILVTHSTNPAWTPAFGRIAALVTESGGMLSHGAIMAREYGIPAVLGVRGATSLIATGDAITVNGTEGRVRPAPASLRPGVGDTEESASTCGTEQGLA
ncbi:PEP/pyruvate-binding domain-containing protein [Noviherbaspirillum sp. ST9]|uniref:PEP/pyruvate-binding domain-containing protein n=1 Tax=Noviherbaspirillum sp. ST9 TaxID=3401606 RepID=UPI003B5894EC